MTFHSFMHYAAAIGISGIAISEEQHSDYQSGVVDLSGEQWHIRTARNTATKPGAFVAFWRRDDAGETIPFDVDRVGAGLMVFIEQGNQRGVFRFTTDHLDRLGVLTGKTSGKRGFRVYPEWCKELNSRALATQQRQISAFQPY